MKPKKVWTPEERARAAELGRLGVQVREKAKRERLATKPIDLPFLEFREAVGRGGASRELWTAIWKWVDGLPLTEREFALFQKHTGRTRAPGLPAEEVWILAGRRGGKSSEVMVRKTWRALSKVWKNVLVEGELGVIPVIASDRKQARNSLRYLKGLCRHPLVAGYVRVIKQDSVEFTTGAIVEVHTASFKASRGYTMLDVVLEECAFYQSEDSANPDEEMLKAIRPAMLTIPDARIYGISSPYARRGILHEAHQAHWGKDEDPVLVINASTLALNPTIPAAKVERDIAADPVSGASEYGVDGLVSFRSDVQALISREAIAAVTVEGRLELPPMPGRRYVAFVDPSGGSVDSFTLGIAHREEDKAVLDLVREWVPPFSPETVTAEAAEVLRPYGLSALMGDRYAGLWPRERFAKNGVTYHLAELTKSELYRHLLPLVNAGRCELLALARLTNQFVGLERRVAWGGKDSIDHAPGGHDDMANSAAGALVLAMAGAEALEVPEDAGLRPFLPTSIAVEPEPVEPPSFRLAGPERRPQRLKASALVAVAGVMSGKPVRCTAEEWPDIRAELALFAGRWVGAGDTVRADLALREVKRLDEVFGHPGIDDVVDSILGKESPTSFDYLRDLEKGRNP